MDQYTRETLERIRSNKRLVKIIENGKNLFQRLLQNDTSDELEALNILVKKPIGSKLQLQSMQKL